MIQVISGFQISNSKPNQITFKGNKSKVIERVRGRILYASRHKEESFASNHPIIVLLMTQRSFIYRAMKAKAESFLGSLLSR